MFPPIASSLYGEKDFTGIRFITKKVLIISLISTSVLVLITMIFPALYLYLFGFDPSIVSSDFSLAIRLYAASFLFYMLNKFLQAYYPSVFHNAPSVLNTLLEKGAIGIPVTMALMFSPGVKGYSLGVLISETTSFALTILFVFFFAKRKTGSPSLLMLPQDDPNNPRYELSVSSPDEVEGAGAFVKEKVLSMGGSDRSATFLSLGAEEFLFNSFDYGYPKNRKDWGVDLSVAKNGASYILSLKDNGISFNPLTRAEDDAPEAVFHGLPLLKRMASRLGYLRILNLNETIMEMDEQTAVIQTENK